MKVLQITTNYPCKENPIFGIFMKEQVESVEKFGVENTIIFSNGLKSNPKIKFSASFIHLRTSIKLFFHLRRHNYDIIHCHNALSGLILQIACGLNNRNTVLSLQIDPETPGSIDQRFAFKLYPKFARLIVKKQLKNQKEKFIYLPNGVNMELFKPIPKDYCKKKLGLDPNKRYILFVDSNTYKARTQKRKDRFDETLKILKDKYGHSDLEELVMTKTNREDVPLWMNACDLYLLTSDEEGSPNAVKECMACNVPVVATPVGNIPDLFESVDGCFMTNTFDSKELAESADKALKLKSGINTRQSIIDKGLDMDSIAERLYSIYKELSNN
ncbi:MAG: glycosyltransferase family 4 protein [Clostridium sp.]|nr:glycosyltransferase family 4 protein [Clostridium sp.]